MLSPSFLVSVLVFKHMTISIYFRDFIYLKDRAQAWGRAEGEADTLLSGDPDAGLDSRSLRS